MLGKDKNYTFTFKLDTKPRRLEIAAVGERPHITINREDFYDYQIKTSAKVTELSINFKSGKEKQLKTFRFKNQSELKRFVQVLNAYRRVNSGFLFFHGDAINKLADDEAKASEQKAPQATSPTGGTPGPEASRNSTIGINTPPPEGYQEQQAQLAPPPKAKFREAPAPPSGPPAPPDCDWYYLTKGNQQKGPVRNEGLKEAVLSGETDVDCRVWETSMGAEWAPMRNLPALFAWIQPPAPPTPKEDDYSYSAPAPPGPPPGPPSAPPGPPPGPPGAPPGPPGAPPGPPGPPPGGPPSGPSYSAPSGGGGGERGGLLAQIQAGKRLKKTETVEKGGLEATFGTGGGSAGGPPPGGPPPGGPPKKSAPLSMQEEMAMRQQKMRRG